MTDKPERKQSDRAIGCLAILICLAAVVWCLFKIPAAWAALCRLVITIIETLAAVHPVDRLTIGIVLAVILHARITHRRTS